jgi:hypothetical protein
MSVTTYVALESRNAFDGSRQFTHMAETSTYHTWAICVYCFDHAYIPRFGYKRHSATHLVLAFTSPLSQFTTIIVIIDSLGCGSNPSPLGKGSVDTLICIGSQCIGATELIQRCKSRSAFWLSSPAPKLANLFKAVSEAPEC